VPVGVIGEIYIGGTQLAYGYHDRTGLTAERFVADPFTAGGRMFRTGDLGRRNADGHVDFVGRADEQMKVRGCRVDFGEVMAAISVDPSVGRAAVVARHLPGLGRGLVAYVTPAKDVECADVDGIRTRVSAALPDHMVPAAYVAVHELPMTAHGKVDHDALPEPDMAAIRREGVIE
jgi:mycobactin peptide synthetase MbtE